jgi:hypothetical protein
MKIAYADPPYIGQAKKHYGREEVDHEKLLKQLELYPGWALSLSSPSLRIILPICPPEARVMIWVKPFCSFKKGVNPAYAYEPVIVKPARKPQRENTVRDWVSCNITLKRGVHGAKPEAFCFWLFEVLGMRKEDTFLDLFPGSGAVTQAWRLWRKNESP